jgi:hypothetical protein
MRGWRVGAGGDRPNVCRGVPAAVYGVGSREGREERMTRVTEEETWPESGRPGTAGADAIGDLVRAAVVAATPDSFEQPELTVKSRRCR